jgi:hypothetical protein
MPLLRIPLISPVALLAAAALLAGCSGSDSDDPADSNTGGSGSVVIESDSGPLGDPALKQDRAAGTQSARVAITPEGVPTVIYRLPLKDLKPETRLGAMATVTLTKCAITDYIPHNREHTACEGTPRYYFDPVSIETRFRLLGGKGAPKLSGPGTNVGGTTKTQCTTAVHHCTISQLAEVELSSADLRGDPRWLVLEATATSPAARDCEPPAAARCDVLAVETQKGTAMYAATVNGDPERSDAPPADTSPAAPTLPVQTGTGSASDARRVVYSVELAPDAADLEGDQMAVLGRLEVSEKLKQAPVVSGYLVLSDSPTGTEGRYLVSDSYDDGHSGNAGGNCDTRCGFTRPVAITPILACDVSAGRRYVNLVAVSQRKAAASGETVSVEPGGFVKVTRYYDGKSAQGSANGSCRG